MKNIFGKKKDTYTRIDQSKLLTVKVKALVEDYRRLDKPCLQQALTLLMCGLKSVIFADEISKALKERKLTFDESLSSCYRALLDIVRAMSSEVDLSDEAKAKIKPVINDIIIQNMKPTDRSKLIDFLLKAKLSVSESLQIINELQLYCLTGGEYTHELIKSASDIQNEMALLMILNNSLENSPMDIQRLISTTGADLLIERIIFQNSNEEIECEFAEKFSLVLSEHTNKCLSTRDRKSTRLNSSH